PLVRGLNWEEARGGAGGPGDDEDRQQLEKDVDEAPAGRQGVSELRRDGEQLHGREEERVAERPDLSSVRVTLEVVDEDGADGVDDERRTEDDRQADEQSRVVPLPVDELHETECRVRAGRVASRGCRRWVRSRSTTSASSSACGRRTRRRLPCARTGATKRSRATATGPGPGRWPGGTETTTCSSSTATRGPTRARASSPKACADRRVWW